MKRTENRLFGEQVMLTIQNLQSNDVFKKIFLPLVTKAKEDAYHDLLTHSGEFKAADDKEKELFDQLWAKEEFKNCQLFDEYIEAVAVTDTIWAEEMYLKGIQDTVTLLMLAAKENILDMGISML